MSDTIIQLRLNATTDGVDQAFERTKEQIDKAKQAADEASETLGVKIPSAIKDLLAESELIGPVLEAAFAPLMILAAIQAIAEIIEKIVELKQKSEEQRQANIALESSFQDTSSKIQQEIDKQQEKYIELTKGPIAAMEYGLKHMANEAIKAFKDLEGELDKVSENLANQKKWYDLFDFQNFKEASREIETFKANLDKAMHDAEKANPGDAMAGFTEGLRAADAELDILNDKMGRVNGTGKAGWQAAINKVKEFREQLELAQKEGAVKIKTEHAKVDHAKSDKDASLQIADINANKQVSDALIKLQEETIKSLHARKLISDEEEIKEEKDLVNKKFDQDKTYLSEKLEQLNKHSVQNAAEIKAVTAQITVLEAERATALIKIDEQYYAEQKKNEDEAMKKASANLKEMIKKVRDAKTEQMQEVADKDKLEVKLEEQSIEQKFELGQISKGKEIAELARLKQEELQIEINHLKNLQQLYPKESKEYLGFEKQISKAMADQQLDAAKAVTEGLKQRKQEMDKFFSGMKDVFSGFIQGITSGTETISQAFSKMVDAMAQKFLQGLENQLMQFIQHKLLELNIHAENEAAKEEVSEESHAKEDERTAFSTAKHAFDWATQYVGPVLAAPIAAAAFVAVTALGSAEGGQWLVPQNQLTMLHPQEMVLPAGLASRMRNVIENGGGTTSQFNGGSGELHVHFNMSAVDGESAANFIKGQSRNIANVVYKEMKKKGLNAS